MSPTQRTLKYLRDNGYTAQVVEKWNPYAKVRQDLFGCIDIVALGDVGILGVQATSGSNHSARIVKSLALPTTKKWLECGGYFWVQSWSKKGPRGKRKVWTVRTTFIGIKENGELYTEEDD